MSGYDFDAHEIAALFENGVSAKELAAEMRCSKRTIYNYLKRAGVELKPAGPPSKRPSKDLLRQLYIDKGFTGGRIAALFKVDKSTVQRWLQAYNIRKFVAGVRKGPKPVRIKKAKPGARNALARYREQNK